MMFEGERPGVGPVAVASDGCEPSAAGLIVAQELARELGTGLEVMSVIEPTNLYFPPHCGATRVRDRRERLRILCDHTLTGQPSYTTRILFGDVAVAVARAAESHGARIIVTGRLPHCRPGHATRHETPLAIARAGGVPVLAVPGTARLPRRVVVAVGECESAAHLSAISQALFHDALVVEARASTGDAGATIAGFARAAEADLLVVGQVRSPFGPYQPIEDLPTRLFRALGCAMLVVPIDRHALRPAGEVSGIA